MESGSLPFEQIGKSIDKKVNLFLNSFSRCAVRAILVCLFLILGTTVTSATATKGEGIFYGLGKMLYAFTFSWSPVMILYMNAELGTLNTLYMTVGVYRKKVSFSLAAKILSTCILSNLIGGVPFGLLVSLTMPFQDLPKDSFFFTLITGKLEKATLQILVEAMFASIVANTTVLVSIRTKNDAGKVAAIIFIIFIFAFLGFEHVIASFPTFSLVYFASNGTIETFTAGNVVHNLFWAFIGNFTGDGLIMGLGYTWLDKGNKNLTYFDQLTNQLY